MAVSPRWASGSHGAATDARLAASGRIGGVAVAPPAPAPAEGKDQLKLSKSESGKGGAAGKGGGQDRVNSLQEEVIAKDKALKESQSRVADLEKQIRDMQRLLDLKGGAATKTAEAPKTPEKTAKVEPAKVEPPKVEPPKAAEAPKPGDMKPLPQPAPKRRSRAGSCSGLTGTGFRNATGFLPRKGRIIA